MAGRYAPGVAQKRHNLAYLIHSILIPVIDNPDAAFDASNARRK